MHTNTPLILASTSPRRILLLQKLGIPFEVFSPNVTENNDFSQDPKKIAIHNALKKAEAIAQKMPEKYILGADTLVTIEGHILGKPSNHTQAEEFLRLLSGKTHTVITGIALVCTNNQVKLTHAQISTVTLKSLTKSIIQTYITRTNPLDKAGAYGIQDLPELIIEKYSGSFYNIMGLPLEFLKEVIPKFIPPNKKRPLTQTHLK